MGFDNECVPNIQSLAGEYFCPVCRLLVYPNEALQSQCTHLYCKPCLTYIVSTTRACPYDGYLVTEADSKPLTESNKALAEAIGKITVHCLYNRSGCTWQGTLTDSTSHCSGCAFGNSPVVCNRCGLQIVHRQVHEHAHTCTGVQSLQTQAQPAVAQNITATGTAASSDQNQASTQAVAISSQAQTSQTAAITTPGQDLNQKTNATTQSETSMPAVTQTVEAWYQQQQQYQQYYQQYPGYDPYQQHYQQYYPYQQQAIAQYPHSQPQVQMQPQVPQSQPQLQIHPQAQPQVQPQSHPQVQQPVVAQPQNPVQQYVHHAVQPQSQIQSQPQTPHGAPPAQSQLHPLPIHPQPQMPAAQYQQPHLQIQHPQSQVQAQAQTQPNLQVQTQAHAHPQPLVSQPMNPNLQPSLQHPSTHLVTAHQSYPQPQFQPQQQVQTGAVQHPLHMHPHGGPQPQHSVQMQSQLPQQPPLLRPHATTQTLPQPSLLPSSAQAQPHQPVHSHAPGIPANQHHIMQTVQQPMHPQYVQQQQPVFSGPSLGPVQSQAHQQGPYSQLRPQGPPQLMQQPPQAYPQQHHGIQTHQAQGIAGKPVIPYPVLGTQPYPQSVVDVQRSAQAGVNHQFGNLPRTNNQLQLSSEQSTVISGPNTERQSNKSTSEKGGEGELSNQKNVKQAPDEVDAACSRRANVVEVKTVKSESDLGSVNDQIKPKEDLKDSMELHAAENGELLLKLVKQEPAEVAADQRDIPNQKQLGFYVPENSVKKDIKAEQLDDPNMKSQSGSLMLPSHSVPVVGQGIQQPSAPQQRPVGPPLLQTPPPGYSHHSQFPGHLPTQERPLGPGHTPYLGPALHQHSEHLQQPLHKQSHGSENFPGGIAGPGSGSAFGGVPSEAELFPRSSGPPRIDSSSTFGLPDDKFRPLADDRINSFPPGPARYMIDQGGIEDLKRFPRPSHFTTEPDPKFASHFSSSRHLDGAPHGFGMNIAPRPLEKVPRAGSLGGVPPSRFFPPYHRDGVLHPNDVGERDTARIHSDYLGPGSGYGRRHMDGLALRSPGRDYPGISSRGFPVLGLDDVDGRDSYRFNDPVGNAFHDSRFPVVAPHLLRGEFDGPGRDGLPSHLPRGENFGPRNLQSHLQLGEAPSFAAFPGHSRMGEFPGPGNFRGPRLGEPGFRSSFSQKGFPSDAGRYTGILEFSDNSRKRRPPSMGWCRICKVDCETVEGLDLHSQTREHQKMAMDMVITIKQNAKKQKLASSNHSSVDDGSKSKAASVEGSGNKD